MGGNKLSRLRFNFGFLLEASLGTSRNIELDYPTIHVEDDLILSPLKGKFSATRSSRGIYISGKLGSRLEAECARCLDPVQSLRRQLAIGEDGILDLAPLVRQLSLLEIPMQPFCRADCKGLCVVCGQNLNEGSCDCEIESIDPRLATLKALLDE